MPSRLNLYSGHFFLPLGSGSCTALARSHCDARSTQLHCTDRSCSHTHAGNLHHFGAAFPRTFPFDRTRLSECRVRPLIIFGHAHVLCVLGVARLLRWMCAGHVSVFQRSQARRQTGDWRSRAAESRPAPHARVSSQWRSSRQCSSTAGSRGLGSPLAPWMSQICPCSYAGQRWPYGTTSRPCSLASALALVSPAPRWCSWSSRPSGRTTSCAATHGALCRPHLSVISSPHNLTGGGRQLLGNTFFSSSSSRCEDTRGRFFLREERGSSKA